MKNFTEEQIEYLRKSADEAEKLFSPYACRNAQAVRRYYSRYDGEFLRSQYSVDTDKIIHSPFFNRGSDKTQVFSFYKNDDITRRASHVQLVSRIARTIGKALKLNLDLIEAIAIGHDIGHTPFGHKGEFYLNALYNSSTGRYFNHNVHSVRVLQTLSGCNLTLQTVDGILCHCGEKVNERYEPSTLTEYEEFTKIFESCYTDKDAVSKLHPATLEGCVVRISDMIAYIGKDRQDAARLGMEIEFDDAVIGKNNSEMINNLITDVIANSLDKPYLSISGDVYESLVACQKENGRKIYACEEVNAQYDSVVKPMIERLYERFLNDLNKDNRDSLIFKSHLNHKIYGKSYCDHKTGELDLQNPDDIVVDCIAGMTDDYFLEVYKYLYPDDEMNNKVKYAGYFDNL